MVIHRTFSFGGIYQLWIVRLAMAAVTVYALSHFRENPVVITVLVIVITILFLKTGYEELIVYPDRFEYHDGSLLKYFAKKYVFYYMDVKEITCTGVYQNEIDITFVNDESKRMRTSIHKKELKKAIAEIKRQLSHTLPAGKGR